MIGMLRVSSEITMLSCQPPWCTDIPSRRANFIRDEFAKLGLAAAIQNYTFMTPSSVRTNLSAPIRGILCMCC